MKTTDHIPHNPEQQGIEAQARLAVNEMVNLVHEATTKLHANATDFDHNMRKVPSFTAPIYQGDGGTRTETGSIEVHNTGLIGDPNAFGVSVTRRFAGGDIRDKYWISTETDKKALYNVSLTSQQLPESGRLQKCIPSETVEIIGEFKDALNPALHPEKAVAQESATRSLAVNKRNGGVLTRMARRLFDPSKVFPKK